MAPHTSSPEASLLRNTLIFILRTGSASYHRLAQAATFPFYLGQPHFTPSEVKYLTSMEVNHGITLGDIIKSTLHVGNQRRQEMVDIDRVYVSPSPPTTTSPKANISIKKSTPQQSRQPCFRSRFRPGANFQHPRQRASFHGRYSQAAHRIWHQSKPSFAAGCQEEPSSFS